jgi:hypothetical protein
VCVCVCVCVCPVSRAGMASPVPGTAEQGLGGKGPETMEVVFFGSGVA